MEDVTRTVGTSSMKATLIQKSENMTAVPRAKATIERATTVKVRRGRNDRASWATRKDWGA